MRNRTIFEKLRSEERDFLSSVFIAPSRNNCPIHVFINGVIMKMRANYNGWGVFRPVSYTSAEFVREPTKLERSSYLNMLKKQRLIFIDDTVGSNEKGELYRIHLMENVERFDTIIARTDGYNLWFDSVDRNNNRQVSDYLKVQLALRTKPSNLRFKGLTQPHRLAYQHLFDALVDPEEFMIQDQCLRGGATLIDYHVVDDQSVRVNIMVDGKRFTPLIKRGNLQTISAGICLSGGDSDFDLQSLITVFKDIEQSDGNNEW